MKAQDLKNSLLKLAIQGKLVEQNPNDEPAFLLLEKIKAEKEQLIKEKKIKREKSLPEISEEEKPFEIPESWEWVRLGELSDIYSGNSINKNIKEKKYMGIKEGYPYIATKDVDSSTKIIDYNNGVRIPYDEEKFKIAKSKSILICAEGGSAGKKIGLLNKDVCFGNKLINFNGFISEINKYVYYLFQSVEFYQQFVADMTGIIGGISINKFKSLPIAVPPLEEQKRIVAKIEEVLEKIEEYDKAEKELTQLEKSFPQDMKKSILQYAIQGKLVEQNPNDEPALTIIKQVNENIKTEFNFDFLMDIPNSWEYVKLGDILKIARGGSPRPIKQFLTSNEDGVNWIKIGDTVKGSKYIESAKEKIIHEGITKSRFVKKGDFILSNSMSFGRPYILNIDGCVHDGWLVLSEVEKCFNKDYLYYLLSSKFVYYQFCGKASGAVVNNLNIQKVMDTIIPLPPLEEQKRIVEKIEVLLNYVDRLHNKIDNQSLVSKILQAKSIEIENEKELIKN